MTVLIPCSGKHEGVDPVNCRYCRLAATNGRYAELWGVPKADVRRALYLMRKGYKPKLSVGQVAAVRRH